MDHMGAAYRGIEEYLGIALPFAENALAQGNSVLVAVPAANLDMIRKALPAAGDISFVDLAIAGCNPRRIIPGVLLRFADRHRDRRVSIIAEPTWPGRSADEYPACMTHEALVESAFAGREAEMLCAYDAQGLARDQVADANSTHPVLCNASGRWQNSDHDSPLTTVARFNQPLPLPPIAVGLSYAGAMSLAGVRRFVAGQAVSAGLEPDRAEAMVMSVNELATNTARHTGGPGEVSAWREDGVFVCQVSDSGVLTDPLAGLLPVRGAEIGGHGLLMVNELVDLVRVHTSPAGTTIRLYQRLRHLV
jgi:anti-sigma regulatory factor (Ser/Thr protein kinase)